MSDLHGCPVNISYLYAMKKDELIELLKEQIKGLRDDNNRLLVQIDALTKEVSSLKEALLQKGESLGKQQRIAKGLAKLVSNTSERQQAPRPALSEEERRKAEAEKAAGRKARKNNGARRDMHYELEEEEHVVYPDDPDFDINKARLFTPTPRICVRYECVPMRFIKHVYKIHTYTQDGRLFEGKTPASAFLNSSNDSSFIAGMIKLRYIQSLPVERIISYFEGYGFTLKKPTAHKLMEKASGLFENLYQCIRRQPWAILIRQLMKPITKYSSRKRTVREKESARDTSGWLWAYSPYRKLESDAYPHITRIPCLQHIKRKFIDSGENDPDVKRSVELINKLYQNEHKHKVGVDGWTAEQHLAHRKKYALDILGEIKDVLDEIEERGDLLPKSELREAITYFRNEWNAVVDIFNYGDTFLDNNIVERMNRYIFLSRKNSLFFGSHKGAERGAILYTIALTCRMHKVNLFKYLTDVINRTAEWQPNTPLEKYRELLPDKWEKENS